MTDQKNTTPPEADNPEADNIGKEQVSNPYAQLAILVLAIIAIIIFAYKEPRAARAVLLVALGFGGVIMIHELGHFLVAKFGGIRVEAFSIGFPPVALGIRKLKKGFRVRLLPRPGQEQTLEEGDSETEYQVGLVPLGGFVKMMGQSDTGSVEQTNDPRSFLNRPLWIRIAVVAAGVTFNAIAAMLLFMGLFLHGIDLKPAVVGEVMPNSPAYEAGLRPGDEIVEVNGNRFVDYEALVMVPVLAGKGQPISFVVQREGGREETIQVIPEVSPSIAGPLAGLQSIGISPAHRLTIEPLLAGDPELMEEVFDRTGLRPNDEIKAINNQPVATPWELRQRIRETIAPEISLTVSRSWPEGSPRTQETLTFPTRVDPTVSNFREEFDLAHVFGMRPCLKVGQVSQPPRAMGLLQRLLGRGAVQEDEEDGQQLQTGDILVRIDQIPYPDFEQLRQVTTEFKNRDLTLVVLRAGSDGDLQPVEIVVRPYEVPRSDRVTIGFAPELAMDVPIVAQTLEGGLPGTSTQLPVGARITAVDGEPVKTFYDIARLLGGNRGQRVSIDYVADGQAGGAGIVVPQRSGLHVQSAIAYFIPYEELTVTFKTDSPMEAVSMGIQKVRQFFIQTILTLYRLIFSRDTMSASHLMGPVGIITVSYSFADASLIHYLYFLGLLSSILAVMNLMPLPVLDGGVIVILTIEKIIGRPISEKVQATITYVGLALLVALMLLVTYNDIMRLLFGWG